MYAVLVITSRFAPETRGRTLEEVNEKQLVVDEPAPAATA
jgi:hypothetical protein